ncbi:hypothetical protein F8C76_06000 [Flagellimonas olearia]|uniref:Lipoprotein n=1 Tax=Flagellimonas olearia TaxID=552546 RepID=A0A6I1E1L4_9FLAO|nr:hypothetical protein [Allomuricauda olearia]KAB7531047.1 hypothetical protein F8C76_06000 [Allomuricauda olearia]
MNKKFNLAPKVFLLLFFSLFLAIGCSKEESPVEKEPVGSTPDPEPEPEPEPEPVVYFTFSSDPAFFDTSTQDNWIILHDSDGNLLDYKPYESGDILEFTALDSELTDTFTVTLFLRRISTRFLTVDNIQTSCEGSQFNIISYPSVSKGSNWLKSQYPTRLPGSPAPNHLGEFTLTTENIPGEFPVLNNYFHDLGNGNRGNLSTLRFSEHPNSSSSSHSAGYTTIIQSGINNWENTSYMMSILHADEGLKYLFFQNPDAGNDLTIDYGDFQAFDSYTYFPLIPENENYTLQMVGYENETSFKTHTGYFCLEVNDINNGMQIPLGALDRFTHYKTFFDMKINDNARYQYSILGPKPTISVIPEKPSVSFTQDGIIGFDFTTNTDYVRRVSYFGDPEPIISADDCDVTFWGIASDQENYPVLSTLPDELYTLYPNLEPIDQLEYKSSTIYLQGKTYAEFLRFEFDPTYDHILKYGDVQEYFTLNRE